MEPRRPRPGMSIVDGGASVLACGTVRPSSHATWAATAPSEAQIGPGLEHTARPIRQVVAMACLTVLAGAQEEGLFRQLEDLQKRDGPG